MCDKVDFVMAYSVARNLQYIRCIVYFESYRMPVKGEYSIIETLRIILKYLRDSELSLNTQSEIEQLIEIFEKSYKENEILKPEDIRTIKERIILWEDRIKNELNQRITMEVSTKGNLNYKKLLEGAQSFFSEDVWNTLSELSKKDLDAACKCLLTQSWTPAVMISLRASEGAIRKFYESVTGNESQEMAWKKILDILHKENINEILLGYLDYIREIRNEAEHPDRVFKPDEAERVFLQVVDIFSVINKELSQKAIK